MMRVEAKHQLTLRTLLYPIRALRLSIFRPRQHKYTTYRVERRRFFRNYPSGTVGKVPLHWPAPCRSAKLPEIIKVPYGFQS